MNKCLFVGNITKDPELRFIPTSGMAVCKFSLALNDGYGEKKTVSYINCVAFGKTAEAVANYTGKGSKVAVEARVKTGGYDKQDGTKVYTTDFMVDKIEFLDSRKKDEDVFTPADFNPFEEADEDIPF